MHRFEPLIHGFMELRLIYQSEKKSAQNDAILQFTSTLGLTPYGNESDIKFQIELGFSPPLGGLSLHNISPLFRAPEHAWPNILIWEY